MRDTAVKALGGNSAVTSVRFVISGALLVFVYFAMPGVIVQGSAGSM